MKLSIRNLSKLSYFLAKQFTFLLPASRKQSLYQDSLNVEEFKQRSFPNPVSDQTHIFRIYRHNIRLELDIYYQPMHKSNAEKTELLRDIRNITKQAWEDFGDVIQQWFDWADILVMAKVDGQVVGFNACTYEQGDVVLYLASFVLPKYQAKEVSKFMQNIMIKKLLLMRSAKRFFQPVWFTFRTQNPRVIHRVYKFNAAPSVEGREPSETEVSIAKQVAKRFSPDCEFDERNFVIKKALKNKPDLLAEDKVFYSLNQKVNAFCDKHLQYPKKEGHLFVCVGRVNWFLQLYLWFKY